MTEPELQQLRVKINSRERKRIRPPASPWTGCARVMPYAHGPSVRKALQDRHAAAGGAFPDILMLTNSWRR